MVPLELVFIRGGGCVDGCINGIVFLRCVVIAEYSNAGDVYSVYGIGKSVLAMMVMVNVTLTIELLVVNRFRVVLPKMSEIKLW